MKKVLFTLVAVLVFSSVGFASNFTDLPLKFEVGAGVSIGYVNLGDSYDDLLDEFDKGFMIIAGLATRTRGSVHGNVRYVLNDLVALGGELELGMITFSNEEHEYSIVHIPVRTFARVNLGGVALDSYIGINTMFGASLSESNVVNAFEYGFKLYLGNVYAQYAKERDMQNYYQGLKYTYTRIGVGYRIPLF